MPITGGSSFDTTILDNYLYLPGRISGQVLGGNAHTGGTLYDLAIEGRLLLGDNLIGINYTTGRVFDIRQLCRNAVTQANLQYSATGFTGTASGIWRGLQLLVSGTAGYTNGIISNLTGFFFTNSVTLPNGVNCTNSQGGIFQCSPQEAGVAGGITGFSTIYGLQFSAVGPSAPNTGHVATKFIACGAGVSNRSKAVQYVVNHSAEIPFPILGTVDHWALFASATLWGQTVSISALVTNWYGLYLNGNTYATAVIPTNRYGIWIDDWYKKNVLNQPTTIAGGTDPIHGTDNQGSFGLKTTANKVAAYNAAAETVIPCDATAAAFAVNLPSAVGIMGRVYIVKKMDATANAVTITPNGAETIDGAATLVLAAQWAVARVISNNANWLVI